MELSFVYSGNETVGAMVVSRLEAAGCTRTDDVAHAEAIITYCTSQTALEDAYFDEQGLVQAAGKGALLIDLSASTPSFARELNAVAVVSDLMSVEAPLVVVDVARADAFGDRDNLVCFVGGDEEAVAEARPVLEAIAGTVQETGGAGSAQLARAAYTLRTTAQVISAVEADALYRAVRRSDVYKRQVWVSLEIGPDVAVRGDVFADVDDAVARAYDEARLRKSVVRDAVLDRANTGDNTPAFCDVHPVDEQGAARLHVMLKGGGSDNASRVVMLVPGAGKQGIVDELVRCVREKGANACPPLVVGVGIGSTFDKVAGLAKRALMRPVDEPAADDRLRALEEELLAAVNATGIGPGGLGGRTTALAVRVATAPCHIAALPLAINMGCSAMRRITVPLACQPAERLDAAASRLSLIHI